MNDGFCSRRWAIGESRAKMPAFAAMKLLFIYWGPDNPHQFYYGNSKERNLHADLSL
jgi:hypothetical protein